MNDLISKKALLADLHKQLIERGIVDYRAAKELVTDAPAALDKYEPVGELILDPAFLPALKSPLVNWKINLVDLEVGTKFFTSPQPRDWVSLTDEQKNYIRYHRPTDLVNATEAKLKQLNTKG